MKTRAILFDLDNTLYEYEPCNRHALAAAHDILNRAIEVQPIEFQTVHDEVRQHVSRELRGQAASHNRAIFFKRIVEEIAGRSDAALVRRMYDAYWEAFYEHIRPQADALDVLARLGSERLVLVTNHTALPQLGKIAALGIETFFAAVVTSEEAGVEKPAARIFEMALERVGAKATESVMIGDDVEDDIIGPAALGMRTIQTTEFSAKEKSERADFAVARLGEILSILE